MAVDKFSRVPSFSFFPLSLLLYFSLSLSLFFLLRAPHQKSFVASSLGFLLFISIFFLCLLVPLFGFPLSFSSLLPPPPPPPTSSYFSFFHSFILSLSLSLFLPDSLCNRFKRNPHRISTSPSLDSRPIPSPNS